MKCENCYHKKVCSIARIYESENHLIGYQELIEKCEDFKDKDLMLKLPCKVGDVVYQIDNGEIYLIKVLNIVISDCSIEFNGFETDDEEGEFNDCSIELSEFGKTVFSTCEEAEKALEECKK